MSRGPTRGIGRRLIAPPGRSVGLRGWKARLRCAWRRRCAWSGASPLLAKSIARRNPALSHAVMVAAAAGAPRRHEAVVVGKAAVVAAAVAAAAAVAGVGVGGGEAHLRVG